MKQLTKGYFMKSVFLIALALVLSSCGYSSRNSELIGQVKNVSNETPLLCHNRVDADISLGIMRNGVGSMSKEDVWLTVPNAADQDLLKRANESGELVKVTYDIARVNWCWKNVVVSKVEIVK